jgi:hypothetical protein
MAINAREEKPAPEAASDYEKGSISTTASHQRKAEQKSES